ncbi:hypothetical protein KZP23_17260 [Echinicola marina]|uniref:hypothetical protein n=1 Tax=Echinicola marina TaxID=2859768 RepID=UPI001CF68EF2|nr:hypothetical protein [Echinicola marina]UCS92430.1 hypothetical protein KZP23_17260 [Echinicola marina]
MKKNYLLNKYDLSLYFLLITVFIFCLLNHYIGHSWGDDFSLYLNQAKALLNGSVERVVSDTVLATTRSSIQTFSPQAYPWGYPILLSPCYYFFNMNINQYKIVQALYFISFLGTFFLLIKTRIGNLSGLIVIGLIGLNHTFIFYTNHILTEIPFMLFSTLSLLAIDKGIKRAQQSIIIQIVIGILLVFTFSIRTEGGVLLLVLLISQLLDIKNKRKLNSKVKLHFYLIPYFVFFTFYLIGKEYLPTGFTSHFGFLTNFKISKSISNLEMIINLLGIFINRNINIVSLIIILSIFVIGVINRFKKDLFF